MKRYLVIKQNHLNEREFEIQDIESGEKFYVDLYTNGNFEPPLGADETHESWVKWLKETFDGKEIEIESIIPYGYFISGDAKLINVKDL